MCGRTKGITDGTSRTSIVKFWMKPETQSSVEISIRHISIDQIQVE